MPHRSAPKTELYRVRRLPPPPTGGPLLSAKQQLYIRLMVQGMNNVAACRVIGISTKTGTRWKNGRTMDRNGRVRSYRSITGVPPRGVARPVSPRFLSEGERLAIADGRLAGQSLRSIATELGPSPSTISREAANNADPVTGRYRPHGAQRQAEDRRLRPKPASSCSTSRPGPLRPELPAEALEPRAGKQGPGGQLSWPSGHASLSQDHLPGALPPGPSGLRRELASSLRTGRVRRK